jgi:hypothetical protein
MAKRYIGDAVVTIEYTGQSADGRSEYAGTVRAGGHEWTFDHLGSGVGGPRGGVASDSPAAYDEMAQSAVGFASYYTTDNRGDAGEWAPPPDVADAIADAVNVVLRDDGTYEVRRSPKGKVFEVAVAAAKTTTDRALDEFTRDYVASALWSSSDSDPDDPDGEPIPLDRDHGLEDVAPETMELMREDCADFVKRFGHLVEDDDPKLPSDGGSRWGLAGYDFWLTREGHGAGFWDGDWPKHGDELTEAAKSYGRFELYVGDDGQVWGPPADWYRDRQKGKARTEEGRNAHVVRDFASLPELIEHAKTVDGATHLLIAGRTATLFFPRPDGQYEAADAFQERGYWHAPAPTSRRVVPYLPAGTEPIGSHARRAGARVAEAAPEWRPGPWGTPSVEPVRFTGRRAFHGAGTRVTFPDGWTITLMGRVPQRAAVSQAEWHRARGEPSEAAIVGEPGIVRDYVPVDYRGRPVGPPTRDYGAAKREADQQGGYVKFTNSGAREPRRINALMRDRTSRRR